ncbi:MAG: hypothetical protein NTU49_00080 [Gammaproteobacteria bacterium]|nr:hypothetical protein [Gammaproteobacteria bacterium]
MNEPLNPVIFTRVKFILHPEKQPVLMQILMNHVPLTLDGLSRILNISQEKLIDAFENEKYLEKRDAKKLAKYFCFFCGS